MIYLDHAATTPMCREAWDAMKPCFSELYGNPSGICRASVEGKKIVTEARREIAAQLHARPQEIFFTSGGTEADNWALRGIMEQHADRGRHLITTAIEHHAILRTCDHLEKEGYSVTRIPVRENGIADPAEIERAIRPDTVLVSVMAANNEIGTLQPLAAIGKITRSRGVLLHTDAVQAFGQLPLYMDELDVDLLSASGHKLYGPKGIGFLYVRSGVKISPLLFGGMQERGRRAGTENVPAIAGLAAAVKASVCCREETNEKERSLRDHLIRRVLEEIPGSMLNGDAAERLPGNASFCFEGAEGEALLILLDMAGICASGGSACTSGSLDPSHVMRAIGRDEALAKSALRFTLGRETTLQEIDEAADRLKEAVTHLRKLRNMPL